MNSGMLWISDPGPRQRFPVVQNENGRLLANPKTSDKASVAVISIPKSGTYLVARLLEEIGFVDTELHCSPMVLTDYRDLTTQEKRSSIGASRTVYLPIAASSLLVGPGQFFVGHLPYQDETLHYLSKFKKLFLTRDLITATLSHMRFLIESKRGDSSARWMGDLEPDEQFASFLQDKGRELVLGSYEPLLPWSGISDVETIAFEDLVGEHGEESQHLAAKQIGKAVGIHGEEIVAVLKNKAIGQTTPTLSSKPTILSEYLSEVSVAAASECGLIQVNEKMKAILANLRDR